MSSPSQLYLLADHIKLSLLERQRAISLNLEPNSQDGNISRSLESMREGIEGVEEEASRQRQQQQQQDRGDDTLRDQAARLRTQYDDLVSQFRGFPTTTTTPPLTPNTASLKADFSAARTLPPQTQSSSALRRAQAPNGSKSVRFTDAAAPPTTTTTTTDAQEAATRAALFPYRDDPADAAAPDHGRLDNVQIHAYHRDVIREQDEQLDRLGVSIGRQRDLSIQIGDELDGQVEMLDEVDYVTERHQGRLDGARKSLGHVARKAGENKQLTTIFSLVIILVLLIIILK